MRAIWSQENFWRGVREVWRAGVEVQAEVGLASDEEVEDLQAHADDVSVPTI